MSSRGLAILCASWILTSPSSTSGQAACVGDCNDNDQVSINELVIGVNIILELAPVSSCRSFDTNDSNSVEINELVQGVNNVLEDCPPRPATATPTNTQVRTSTLAPPTVTRTPTATEISMPPTVSPTDTPTHVTATPTGPTPTGTPPPPLPDLVVDSVELAPVDGCLEPGEEFPRLRVCVSNQSAGPAAPFDIGIDGQEIAVVGLAGSAVTCVEEMFIAVGTAIVDVNEDVAESNEMNNELGFNLPIPSQPTTCTPGGATHTPTPLPTNTEAITPSPPASTATATGTPSSTVTPAPTQTSTITPSSTSTLVPTATRTQTPSPSATSTPDLELFAGVSVIVVDAVGPIPNLLGIVLNGIKLGGGFGAGLEGGAAGGGGTACPVSGTVNKTGTDFMRTWTFTDCTQEVTPGGKSIVFNGMVAINIANPLTLTGTASTTDLSVTFRDESKQPTLTTVLNISASVRLGLDDAPGDPCNFDIPPSITDDIVSAVALTQLNGSATVITSVGSTLITTFLGANANISIDDYSALCVPIDYGIVLDGAAQVVLTASGGGSGAGGIGETSFDVTYDGYRVGATVADSGITTMSLGGALESPCFGGRVELATPKLVTLPLGEICPTDGTVVAEGAGRILFDNGMVGIDTDNDGMAEITHQSCIAAPLLLCPA